jgi:hypothetical protein
MKIAAAGVIAGRCFRTRLAAVDHVRRQADTRSNSQLIEPA